MKIVKDALSPGTVGKIVTLCAMDCIRRRYSEFFLDVMHPENFQDVCFRACQGVPGAYFDGGEVYGWIRHFDLVGKNFMQELLPSVHPDDIDSIKFWFRNGHDGLQYECPVKSIWLSAFRWAWRLKEPVAGISSHELELIKKFWAPIREQIISDEFENVMDEIANDSNSERDETIKIHFHLNPVGDRDYFFQDLHFMREGFLLISAWKGVGGNSEMETALQKLPYAWWDQNPDRRKYLDFDIRKQPEFLVGGLVI